MPESFPSNPRVLDSRGFLALKELPRSLLVMGGGYIGCELAGAAAQLGLEVTLVELLEDILLGFNQDVRREVRKALETLVGVRILTGQPLTEVQCQGDRVAGVCGDKRLEADMILVAIGRKPFTAGLELERAGLHTNAHGFLEVNDFGQTPVSGIYAVGDVNGRMPLAHAATSQGITAAENACGLPPRAFETVVPGVVFTSPEVGVVGLSEEEAKQRGIPVAVGRFGFGALGRTVASGQTIGFAKWIAQPDTHVLLGAAVVGPHATELIAEAAVAIRARLKVADLATTIHAHPTFGEIWMEAAHAVERRAIHGAPARRS